MRISISVPFRFVTLLLGTASAVACGGGGGGGGGSMIVQSPAPTTSAPGGGVTSSPTPVPSPTPTATPGQVAVSSASYAFAGATASPQVATVSQQGGNGSFMESDTCAQGASPIATIVAGTANGTSVPYTIAPQNVGTCVVTFAASSSSAQVRVTVSNPSTVTVQ